MATRQMAALAIALAAAAACGRPWELYQPIVDRLPFGEGPDDPSVPPETAAKGSGGKTSQEERDVSKEQEALEKAVRVSVLTINPDGNVMVGFSDLSDSKKQAKHYYMSVGETRGDWFVKEADVKEKTVVLVKGGDLEIVRKLGEESSVAAKTQPKENEQRAAPARRSPMLGRGSIRGMKRESEEADRRDREAREEEMRRKREEDERRRAEEKEEREAEKEQLRADLNSLREEMQRSREEARRRAEEERQNGEDDEN